MIEIVKVKWINGKTPQEIRKAFGVEEPYPPGHPEWARVEKENEWEESDEEREARHAKDREEEDERERKEKKRQEEAERVVRNNCSNSNNKNRIRNRNISKDSSMMKNRNTMKI
ncbi:hypothetical protein niasHS_011446 [Heterodera schachtii]|uniref:SKP1 component dimerisation domain-containing protein n=1 Tax=Heterodera schachtii TaxID=97005 RepID=A0ABD2IPX6_HETSC